MSERDRWVLPEPSEPCGWCNRRRGAPLPLYWAVAADATTTGPPVPAGVCDACAGLLGLTPYDPRADGPHARADAYAAVALLTGVEPLTPRRSRRCAWAVRAGWCPVCARLLDAAAYAAGWTLLPAAAPGAVAAAWLTVAESRAARAA